MEGDVAESTSGRRSRHLTELRICRVRLKCAEGNGVCAWISKARQRIPIIIQISIQQMLMLKEEFVPVQTGEGGDDVQKERLQAYDTTDLLYTKEQMIH